MKWSEQKERMDLGRERSRWKKVKVIPPSLDNKKYRSDIVKFANEQFYIETREPIKIESWQIKEIIEPLFYSGKQYRLAVIGLCKKEGKSTLASIVALHKLLYGDDFSEIYICANDLQQAQNTVFSKITRCIELNYKLAIELKITADRIENKKTGSFIQVLPQDFSGTGGFSPALVIFDELWAYRLENARRFFELLCENPARPDFLCLIISHAGYEKSGLLYELFEAGQDNKNPDYFYYWSHENKASWKTKAFLTRQKNKPGMRPNLFRRLYANQWVDSEQSFFTETDYNSCVNKELRPALPDRNLVIYIGVDASVSGDASAVVSVTRTIEKIRLIGYRVWQPTRQKKMNLDATIGNYLRKLYQDFRVKKILYDPFQLHDLMTRLKNEGLPVEELRQSQSNCIAFSQLLYELLHYGNIEFYPNKELKEHILNSAIKESPQGFRITKRTTTGRKIDLAIALAEACFTCSQQKITTQPGRTYVKGKGWSSPRLATGRGGGKVFFAGELQSGGVKKEPEKLKKLKLKILSKRTEKKKRGRIYFRGMGG